MTTDSALHLVDEATGRMLATVVGLTERDATAFAAPSLCPGWSRAHVLAHVARNADGLVNLLTWARTGTERPMYASWETRNADIATGAARDPAALVRDVAESAARLREAADALPADRWDFPVRTGAGDELVVRALPWVRLREVELHHVDLDAGYRPADWPRDFIRRLLPEVVGDHRRAATSGGFTVRADDLGEQWEVPGADDGSGDLTTVSGDASELLAWLTGRSRGEPLAVSPGRTLPQIGAWR